LASFLALIIPGKGLLVGLVMERTTIEPSLSQVNSHDSYPVDKLLTECNYRATVSHAFYGVNAVSPPGCSIRSSVA
jgi:hypothetical protein